MHIKLRSSNHEEMSVATYVEELVFGVATDWYECLQSYVDADGYVNRRRAAYYEQRCNDLGFDLDPELKKFLMWRTDFNQGFFVDEIPEQDILG